MCQLLRLYRVSDRGMKYERGAAVEWYWQGKPVFGEIQSICLVSTLITTATAEILLHMDYKFLWMWASCGIRLLSQPPCWDWRLKTSSVSSPVPLHQRSHMNWHGIKSGPPLWEAGISAVAHCNLVFGNALFFLSLFLPWQKDCAVHSWWLRLKWNKIFEKRNLICCSTYLILYWMGLM